MAIDGLFTKEELEDMRNIVEQEKAKARASGREMKQCWFYSEVLEPKYRPTQRFINQFCSYNRFLVHDEEITTITELADYLNIARSTISRPLQAVMDPDDYGKMIKLFGKLGGSRGGKNGNKIPNLKGKNRWSYRNP